MKVKLLKIIVVGMVLCLSGISMANVVNLVNGKPKGEPVNLVYKTAYMKYGQKPIYNQPVTIVLRNKSKIYIPLQGYKYVGVVIVSANGRNFNGKNKFAKPQQVSMTTDKKHPFGTLKFNMDGKHGNVSASGGIFY